MAGMFSLLNNNLRPDSAQNLNPPRDDGNGGRSTPRARTPIMNRREFPRMGNIMSYSAGENRLPKRMRKGTAELHPMLRRSICSLIIAAVVIVTGAIFILVDLLALNYQTSVRGMVIIITGFLLVIVGVVWFKISQTKLERYRERVEQARLKKMKSQLSTHHQEVETTQMIFVPSKHATKWPTRKNCNGDSCKEVLTSPNGNHIIYPVVQNHERNSTHLPPLPPSAQPSLVQHEINDNKTTVNALEAFQTEGSLPIRISKTGERMQVPPIEQCTSCAFLNNSKDDFLEKSYRIPLTTS